MPKMTAMQAAVHVLESEGVELVFGVPGAAILPLYEALRPSNTKRAVRMRRKAIAEPSRVRSASISGPRDRLGRT
jgi:glyoxylate carboligase